MLKKLSKLSIMLAVPAVVLGCGQNNNEEAGGVTEEVTTQEAMTQEATNQNIRSQIEYTPEEAAQTEEYWTEERMQSAEPAPMPELILEEESEFTDEVNEDPDEQEQEQQPA